MFYVKSDERGEIFFETLEITLRDFGFMTPEDGTR
jgi:hypothetical protein